MSKNTETITSAEIYELIPRLGDPHIKIGGGEDGLRIIIVDGEDTKFGLFWAPKVETIDQIFDANPHWRQKPGSIAATVGEYGAIGGVFGRPLDTEHSDDIANAVITLFAVCFPDIPELEAVRQTFGDFRKAQIEKAKARAEEAAAKVLLENMKRGGGSQGWGG